MAFGGRVNAAGTRVEFDAPAKPAATLKRLAGQRVEVVIRKPKSKRSLDMNAYWHKWPFRLIADEVGDSIEGVKYDLMGEFFGWVPGPVSGKLIPAKVHTSDMTKEESARFVDWLIPFGLQKFGVVIPLPGEALMDEDEA